MSSQPIDKITTGSYYLIFDQVITYGMGALFWIVLAKMISTTLIGETMVVIALTLAIFGFTGLGAEITISKFIAEFNAKNNPRASRKAFIFGVKIGLGVSLAAGLGLAIISGPLSTTFYRDQMLAPLIMLAMLTYLPFETVLSCFFGAFQGSHKMQYIAMTHLVFQGVRITAAVGLIAVSFGYLSIILSFALGNLVALTIGYIFFIRRLFADAGYNDAPIHMGGIRAFSGFNYLAAGISTLAIQLNYILLGQQNFSSVALFGISYLISGVVGVIVVAFGKAILPTASIQQTTLEITKMSSTISSALRVAVTLSGIIYIILIVDPGILLSSLSREYVGASSALQLLVISAIMVSLTSFIAYIFNAMNKPSWVAKIAVVSSLCVVGSCLGLVPTFGIDGAAVSSLIGSAISLGLSIWLSGRLGVNIAYNEVYKPLASVATAIGIGLVLLYTGTTSSLTSSAISMACYISLIAGLRVTSPRELRQMMAIAVHATGLGTRK